MRRREFLQKSSLLAAAFAGFGWTGPALAGEKQRPALTLSEAYRKARGAGIGSAHLKGPNPAEVDSWGRWTFVYRAGKAGIRSGGGIRIGLRHMLHAWTKIQNEEPNGPGYLTVETPSGVTHQVTVACNNWSDKYFTHYHPVQNIVEVLVGDPGLKPGQRIAVTFGDTSKGSPGMHLQPFDEEAFLFLTFVDTQADGEFLPMKDSPALEIVPGKPAALTALVPSNGTVGQKTTCVVRAEDRFGNPAVGYRGRIRLECDDGSVRLPSAYDFKKEDRGVHRFEGVAFDSEGVFRITASDEDFSARSNPVVVADERPDRQHLWGDIHGHTVLSDGRGTPDQYYEFARRVGALDVCALSDHAFELTTPMWEKSKAATNAAYEPGRFTTFNGYEWSGFSKVGGDHNVYWLDEQPPIFRSTSYYDPRNYHMGHDESTRAPHLKDLYARLREHLQDKNVFCIPHRGGRAANPAWHDPKVQRLIECYCEHFRSRGWGEKFLAKGFRLGLVGSSDGHYGNPGYGFLKPHRRDLVGEGLVCILAPENRRRPVFSALYDRHCYATTGDRIVLDFRLNGRLMGSEVEVSGEPELAVTVHGTAKIKEVRVLRNNAPVRTVSPEALDATFSWRDSELPEGEACYYHVHVIQQNKEEAVSSPIWVTSGT